MEVIETERKEEAYLSLSETARMLGVSERTIHRWIQGGRLPVYKPGHAYRFRLSEVEAFLEEHRAVPLDQTAPPEVTGRSPEERSEVSGALASAIERLSSTYQGALEELAGASADELFALYMQVSLIHVGAQAIA